MTFDTNLQSIEDGAPREGIEIRYGSTVHLIATGSRNVTINGNVFEASSADRSAIAVQVLKEDADLSISLPTSHAFVQRYNLSGNPPQRSTCTIWQQRDGEARRLYEGVIESCEVKGHVATFRMISVAGRAVRRRLPVLTAGRKCPYILYDVNCGVLRSVGFRQITTVASQDGRTVILASIGSLPDQWAQGGELVHIASGERATVSSQIGTTVIVQLPIVDLRDGDQVHLFAGCAHDIGTCHTKFNNKDRFGGEPQLPRGGLFVPGGFGIVQ